MAIGELNRSRPSMPALRVRMAINSRLAIVGDVGSGKRMIRCSGMWWYRMESSVAKPGQIGSAAPRSIGYPRDPGRIAGAPSFRPVGYREVFVITPGLEQQDFLRIAVRPHRPIVGSAEYPRRHPRRHAGEGLGGVP